MRTPSGYCFISGTESPITDATHFLVRFSRSPLDTIWKLASTLHGQCTWRAIGDPRCRNGEIFHSTKLQTSFGSYFSRAFDFTCAVTSQSALHFREASIQPRSSWLCESLSLD